jgi:hypothetical protein
MKAAPGQGFSLPTDQAAAQKHIWRYRTQDRGPRKQRLRECREFPKAGVFSGYQLRPRYRPHNGREETLRQC